MYEDRKKPVVRWVVSIVLVAALLLGACWIVIQSSAKEIREEAEHSIRETVRRAAMQCFTVEGVYPESLDYLKEHYGLRVNTDDYYVVYEVFADNQPPNIRVVRKEG